MHTKHTLISEKLSTFLAISGRLENEFSMMTANKSEHSDFAGPRERSISLKSLPDGTGMVSIVHFWQDVGLLVHGM